MSKIVCPCCGQAEVEPYEICPVCDWENDPVQLADPTLSGGANRSSLEQARIDFQTGKQTT